MTRILVESPQCTASVRVGVLRSLQALEEAGVCQIRYRDTKEIRRRDIVWCDVAVCVRGCEYPTLRFVRAAKEAGRFLVYFLDDDLLDIPQGNLSTKYFDDAGVRKNLVAILSQCDVLWTVNRRIVEKYSRWCPRTLLSKIPAKRQREVPEHTEKLHVLYAGSEDHSQLVRQKLTYAVTALLTECPEKIDFTFIGAKLSVSQRPGLTQYAYFDSYDQYRKIIREGEFSLGLAPSFRTPFYQAKYYNKFIEYTESGMAGLYEECEPYTAIVKNGENGYLCGERPEDWYEKLKMILEDQEGLQRIARRAAEQMEEEFAPEQVSKQLLAGLPELSRFRGRELTEREISLPWLWGLFYRERVKLIGRMYGPLALAVIPWKAVRVAGKEISKKRRGA